MKPYFYIGGLLFLAFCLFIGNLFWGSVSIPASAVWDICLGNEVEKSSWSYIVLQSRFPQAVTAFFAGAALAVSGLMLQTAFNNPLAGPSILGINSGASLGVALVMLFLGGSLGSLGSFALSGTMAVLAGAFIGAVLILGIIILFSTIVRSNVMLLIVGIMVGYITSSAISLLNVFSYTLWGMGDFSGISVERLPFFCIAVTVGLVLSLLLIKPLNALLLGERYAENLGVNVRRVRIVLLLTTGLLTAVVTAFCGPVSFIGLAVPHIARLVLGSSNHKILLPVTILIGAVIALKYNISIDEQSTGY